MLRPSGSLLASSRAAQRRTFRLELFRFAALLARKLAHAVVDVVGAAYDLLVMLGLPIVYAVGAYLAIDLPARLLAGRAHFSGTGLLVFLAALGVSLLGISRLIRQAPPVAPVRPKFARAMLVASWAAALLLTVADLAG
jgi:small-conductance mechanosensitive channel